MRWPWTFRRRARPGRNPGRNGAPAASASDERIERPDPTAALRARGRRRLIGAAALLLAVIVVVPLLLDPAPRPIADNIPVDIPSDKTPFTPRLALPPADTAAPIAPPPDVEPDAASAGSPGATPSPAGPAPAPAPASSPASPSEGKPAAADRGKPAAKDKEKDNADEARARDLLEGKVATAATAKGAGANAKLQLQVAALGSETAAQELSERLRGAGFAPFTERVETREGLRYRVRVGPFASRDDAERARARLRALGVGANLVAP